MKKYSIILLILTGMSTVVFAQDIKVAEKSEENQTTKGQPELVRKSVVEKKVMAEFSIMFNSESQKFYSNTDSESSFLLGGLFLLPIKPNFYLGINANLVTMGYEESDWDEEGSTQSVTLMPYVRYINPLTEYAEIFVDFGIGRSFDLSDDANEDVKNVLVTGSINAAFKVTDKFFIKTTLLNMNYINVSIDNEAIDISNSLFTIGTLFEGPSIGMLFKF
jgi:hypothetical protein